MTSRERFHRTLGAGGQDRAPLLEDGLRDGVLERWRREGLPAGADLAALYSFDRRERIPLNMEPLPKPERWPQSRAEMADLRRRLSPDAPGRLPEGWAARARTWRERDILVELPLHRGFFLSTGAGQWGRFLDVMYQLNDDPALVVEILALTADLSARMAERILAEVEVDFVSFSEPTGGNEGPLLSPAQYKRFALSSYRPILEIVRRAGVETVCIVTYANPRPLIPGMIEAGFNTLWAVEANPEAMDYRSLRSEFGRDLRLIGGIDLDALLAGPEAIEREIAVKVPPLLAQGRYIPLADGRVRENIPYAAYARYRRLLEQTT